MKTIFIPAKSKLRIDKSKILEISKQLPNNIAVVYSIQYKTQAEQIKQLLNKKHNITQFTQVLVCSKPSFSKQTQAILLISDGKFHALSLAYGTKLPIYIYENNRLTEISNDEVKKLEKRQKAVHVKFLNADKVGILVSTKPGQQRLKKALELKRGLKDKKPYILLGDNINPSEFENFGLDTYINTACPRLDMDEKVVNIDELTKT